ncbi:sterol desaturase family protein [Fibrella aquatilis]|uniref:Sterol desaturase family protein n=1 Tax=Fibrella aquatilis TaxID=2817059 RepID=A0A939JWI7_9BACT|nr:sterol desaturase family protein [Fibrella aquatilis]MBO0931957.1 sterol desaturase family protein [Fibrella aquatilis]
MLDFLKSYLGSLAASLAVMGAAYFFVWFLFRKQLKNRKIQLSKRAGWPQIREEILHALLVVLGSAAFASIIFSLRDQGLTKFYIETGKYGIGYEILTVVVMVLLSDTWFYWFHRWMHHPRVYKYVHALHHKSLDVNPFTSNSFHVVEAVWLNVWVLPFVMLVPVSAGALGVVQALGLFNNLKSHLGYELFPGFFRVFPFNMLVTATNHSLHHTQYNGNYGLFFRFWDIVCGTEFNATTTLFNDIHHRKNEKVVDNTHYKPLTISKLKKETADSISVYFTPTDNQFYRYRAGQYLTLRVKIDGRTYDRCFSLSSTPQLDAFLRITVKRNGPVSHYFLNRAKPGDVVASLYPVGDFVVKPSPVGAKKYVMIAGGSGITALFSLLRQVLHTEPQSLITLLYANKSADSIIFKQALDKLAKSHKNLTYSDFLSGQKRISIDDLRPDTDADFYICGPDALKAGMMANLAELKIDKAKIQVEHYVDGYVPWFGLV